MAGYDATDDLDDLFNDSGDYASHGGAAVATRTRALLDGPPPEESINAVLRLAEGLPSLDDVREVAEDDTSDLTELEQQQREQTEGVIDTALAAGDAALWVIAQALDRAAKGRWWRRTHPTLGAYVEDKIHRSAVYGRQLRKNAPLALETAQRTGTIPKPSQVKATIKTEQEHGREAAVTLFESVQNISAELGARPTAESLLAVHKALPAQLPAEPEQQRAVIEQTARHTLGVENGDASIEAPEFESESNEGDSPATPQDAEGDGGQDGGGAHEPEEDIQDAEIVPEHLATLKDALRTLNVLGKTVTRDVFAQAAADPEERAEYVRVREAIIRKTTALRNKALHAPNPPTA